MPTEYNPESFEKFSFDCYCISVGVYNETAFTALDYILDTAAYHGVKVIFTMGDNWQYADSKRNVSLLLKLQRQHIQAQTLYGRHHLKVMAL